MKRYQRVIAHLAASILAVTAIACGVDLARPAQAESSGASVSAISYGGGDGASFATAIVIKGAHSESEGVAAERAYVVKYHADWDPREVDTALMQNGDRDYDLSRYRGRNGAEHVLYFDVTEFFGKE